MRDLASPGQTSTSRTSASRPSNRCDSNGSDDPASWDCSPGPPLPDGRKPLDRRIDVENPGLGDERLRAILKVLTQPGGAFRLVDRFEGAPDRVLADDLLHPQELRQHSVAAQRRDMRVVLVAGEHGEHRRSQNVAPVGRVRTPVAQRTVGDQGVKKSARLEEINEERQLPKASTPRLVIPFHSDRIKETVKIHAARRLPGDNQGLFTRPVSPKS